MKLQGKKEKRDKLQKKVSPDARMVLDVYATETHRQIEEYKTDTDQKMERYIGSLSENFQHGLSAVAEQYSGLNTKIDRVQTTLDSHTDMIGNLMMNMEMVREDIHTIKNDLKKKVDYDEFEKLERRVIALEQKMLN